MPNYMYMCDIVNQETGKTWRQENAEKQHNIPIGTLVELVCDYKFEDDCDYEGVRLYVVYHARDCDMTPLYCLSAYRNDMNMKVGRSYPYHWVKGWPEDGLRVVEL